LRTPQSGVQGHPRGTGVSLSAPERDILQACRRVGRSPLVPSGGRSRCLTLLCDIAKLANMTEPPTPVAALLRAIRSELNLSPGTACRAARRFVRHGEPLGGGGTKPQRAALAAIRAMAEEAGVSEASAEAAEVSGTVRTSFARTGRGTKR
jgi:hypothetical protein